MPTVLYIRAEWDEEAGVWVATPDDLPAGDIANLFDDLLAVDNIAVDRAAAVAQAVDGYRRGLDSSDALRLALSATCKSLATFDSRFVKSSRRLGLKPSVDAPPVSSVRVGSSVAPRYALSSGPRPAFRHA